MKALRLLFLASMLGVTSATVVANSWLQRASLPADARLASMSFGLNGKVYLVGGQHQVSGSDYDLADCWAYDPITNTWSQKADYGGGLISRGVAFSIGSIGYVGYGTVFPAGQLWAYDATANQWTQKASAPIATPTAVRILSAAFTVAGKAYVCGGLDTAIRSDLWEYDPATDSWTQRTSFPGGGRYGAIAFGANGKGYFGTGTNGTNEQQDMWSYDPPTDTWAQLGNFPGAVRAYASAFGIGTRGFMYGGVDIGVASFNDLWEFNALNGTWTQRASNVTRYLATATSLGNKGYFGMGNLGPNFNDWWEYTPDPLFDCLGILNGSTFPGTGCNDGNSCTVNDVIDAACQCAGTYQDTDGDGLCDANDPCPLLANGPGSTFAEAIDLGVVNGSAGGLLGNGCFADRYNSNSIPGSSFATYGKDRFYRFTTNTCGSGLTIQLCEPTNPPGVIAMHILSSNGSNLRTVLKQPFEPCLFANPFTAPIVFAPNTVYYIVVESDVNLSNYLLTILLNPTGPDTDGDGICDLSDECPNAPGTIGSPCNDGNANTSNDVLGSNCVCGGTPSTNSWVQRASFGGGQRAGGFSFALAGKGYVGCGLINEVNASSDVWAYDPVSNAWSQVTSFPVTASAGSVGFTIGETAYVCAAQGNDLWAYDPVGNTWSARAALPASGRFRPFGFALGAYGYVGGGRNGSTSLSDFWRYDPVSDAWLQRADIPGPARWVGASFAVDGIGYIFGGADDAFNDLNDLAAYNPATNTWSTRAPLPGTARRAASGFSIGHAGYVAGGSTTGNLRFNECWEYQPGNNLWNQVTDPGPEGRSSAMAFTIGDRGYLVGGFTGDATSLTADMRMYTQNAQPDCDGIIGGPAVPGSSCDDLNTATSGDVLNGLCQCAGTCTNDADSDGICDENDGCPNTPGYEGQPCNDSNPCTTGDVINGLCQCAGTYADADSDGVCDAQDNCPSLPGQQGDACDDGDANTTNDVITNACVCAGAPVGGGAWTQRAAFGGFPREGAIAFTIGDFGYVGLGLDATTFYDDLWRYDPTTNSWSQCASLDGSPRWGAFSFAVDGKGYIGTGIDDIGIKVNDVWSYNPTTNEWLGVASYPGGGRFEAVAAANLSTGYAGTGSDDNGYTNDFYQYDPVQDLWTAIDPFPGAARQGAIGFSKDEFTFFGFGGSGPGQLNEDLWMLDPLLNQWSQRASLVGHGRTAAVAFTLGDTAYVGTGLDATPHLQDFFAYDIDADTWSPSEALTGPVRGNAVGFSVNGKGYVSTGANFDGYLGDLWEYAPGGSGCTVGAPCDDGLSYTQNDTLTTTCSCAGVCVSDPDLDGICDEVDPCPYQALPVGSACDDFNPCTENDVVQPWCGCAGTPLPDSDGDFICDLLDQCPSSPGSIGYACDDGNPCTANDVIDANCVCAGQIPDANNDGLSDLCNPYVIQTVTNGCSTYMLLSRSNWTNAEAAAVSLGGHLVTINNASEDAFIYNTFTQSGPVERGLWIGFNDVATEDVFVWSSGEASSYTNWTAGEPSNLSGERYAGIFWPSEPRAPQWFDETNGFLPYGFDIGVYMYGVVEIPAVDTDNDGICDAQDSCPNIPGQIGSACNDGNPCTINDVINVGCVCAGASGPDSDGDGVCDAIDSCPNVTGQIGSPCNDQSPCTTGDVLNANCQCAGTPVPDGTSCGVNAQCLAGICQPACTENVTLELRTDLNSQQASWVILDQNTNITLCSGGGYPPNINAPIVENCCLPAGCYRLRVSDSGGDGFVSGGYQLRESGANGRRIIDDMGNFNSGSSSAITSTHDNGSFCVPIGNDRPIFSSCDKLDWVNNQFIVASENTSVSGQFGVTNTTSGYEFWFFDPNGTYSFRRFRNHATSDGFGSSATRACHFKLNGWINSASTPHLPANLLLNVRIRGRVNGVNQPFGPACLFKIDAALAACPRVKLQDNPANTSDFSCGVSRTFGGVSNNSNKLVAAPPQFIPTVASSNVRYQFRFRISGEFPAPGSCIVRPVQTSPTLYLNWTTGERLKCNTQYQVDVRVSKNGGATWCVADGEATCSANPTVWGKVCNVNITTSTFCPSGGTGSTCGNGVVEPGEACDDGNLVNGDGCDANCSLTGAAQVGSNNLIYDGDANGVTMYPNPNRGDQLMVSMTELGTEVGTVTMDIFDMTGKRIVARTITVQDGFVNQVVELNGELAAGLYLVNFNAGDKTFSERLVIQH